MWSFNVCKHCCCRRGQRGISDRGIPSPLNEFFNSHPVFFWQLMSVSFRGRCYLGLIQYRFVQSVRRFWLGSVIGPHSIEHLSNLVLLLIWIFLSIIQFIFFQFYRPKLWWNKMNYLLIWEVQSLRITGSHVTFASDCLVLQCFSLSM